MFACLVIMLTNHVKCKMYIKLSVIYLQIYKKKKVNSVFFKEI